MLSTISRNRIRTLMLPLAFTEADKVLKRENLLKTPVFDGREGAGMKDKTQELEENVQETEKDLWETRSENAQMKAKLRHCQTYTERDRDNSRDGRGLQTRRPDDKDSSRLRADVKYHEGDAHRLRGSRDKMYEWHEEAFASYTEEFEEAQEHEALNIELRNRLSEAASASSSSPTFAATKVSRKEESKVNVPPWPKVNDLGLWKVNLIQAIIIVANDSDQRPWIRSKKPLMIRTQIGSWILVIRGSIPSMRSWV